MEFSVLTENRFSVRKFSDKAVELEKINLILEAARTAPTAANRQPQRIIVANNPNAFAKIDNSTRCRFGSPCVFVICYDEDNCWVRPFDGENSGRVDSSIVTTYMMLKAEDLGLGTLWVMHFDPVKLIEEFSLPENIVPVAILVTGYAHEDSAPSEKHSQRNPMDNMLLDC